MSQGWCAMFGFTVIFWITCGRSSTYLYPLFHQDTSAHWMVVTSTDHLAMTKNECTISPSTQYFLDDNCYVNGRYNSYWKLWNPFSKQCFAKSDSLLFHLAVKKLKQVLSKYFKCISRVYWGDINLNDYIKYLTIHCSMHAMINIQNKFYPEILWFNM